MDVTKLRSTSECQFWIGHRKCMQFGAVVKEIKFCQQNLRRYCTGCAFCYRKKRNRRNLSFTQRGSSVHPHSCYLHFLRGGFPSLGHCSAMLCGPEKWDRTCPTLTWKFTGAEVFIFKISSLANCPCIFWCLVSLVFLIGLAIIIFHLWAIQQKLYTRLWNLPRFSCSLVILSKSFPSPLSMPAIGLGELFQRTMHTE